MASRTVKSALSTSSATRALTRTLEIERKFVPTTTLQQHVRESANKDSFTSLSTITSPTTTIFTRLPPTRITDRYFDRKSTLADKGIWIRYRRIAPLTPLFSPIPGTPDCKGVWQAKLRQAGGFTSSSAVEVEGQAEVNAVIRDAGLGDNVFDLGFWMGFVCERTAWTVQPDGDEDMEVCVDTAIAKVEDRDGERAVYWRHQVGEVKIAKSVSASNNLRVVEEYDALNDQLAGFMATHPDLFAGEGEPVGKLSALVAHEKDVKARLWKVNEPGRVANVPEVAWDRMMAGGVR